MALKITDATKDDFIQFFETTANGKSCKSQFLRWLSIKKWKEVSDAYDTALSASQEAYQRYAELLKKATTEKDFDKKMHYLMEANEKRELSKKYDAEVKRLEKKQDKMSEE